VSGQQDAAIEALRQLLVEAPPGFAGWTIPIEPLLAPIGGTTRFQAVLRHLAARAQ
jgi:hypothetical protein